MTINIALVTSDAFVLGCDSVASITTPMMNPFANPPARDDKGNLLKDKDGNILVPILDVKQTVTDVMPGVTKMFKIYDAKHTVVAAAKFWNGKIKQQINFICCI